MMFKESYKWINHVPICKLRCSSLIIMFLSRIFVNGLYAHNYSEVNALARICQCIYLQWYSSYKGTPKVSINLSFDVYSPRRVNFCGLPTVCRDNRSLQGEQTIAFTCNDRECTHWGVLSNTNNVRVSKVFIRYKIIPTQEFYIEFTIIFSEIIVTKLIPRVLRFCNVFIKRKSHICIIFAISLNIFNADAFRYNSWNAFNIAATKRDLGTYKTKLL